jgi:hypothetical protein
MPFSIGKFASKGSFADNYRISDSIGEGGNGAVFYAARRDSKKFEVSYFINPVSNFIIL